jgi:hypothetical protein
MPLLRVAGDIIQDVPPNCQDLYAIAEATAQLIAQHCPIAQQPMRQAKKKSVKK